MSTILLLQVLINGFVIGLVYSLIAAGFSLIFSVARVLFFAHGEIYMVGAILAYSCVAKLGLPYPLALILIPPAVGLFGILLEGFLFRPLRSRGGQDLPTAISSLALGMLIAGVTLHLFGTVPVGFRTPFPGKISVFGAFLTVDRLVVILISIVLLFCLHFFLQRVRAGRAMRAVSQDPEAATLMGINLNRSNRLLFFVALAFCAVAGILTAPLYGVDVFMGSPILMKTLVIVILGGLGSFPGAVIGGLFLGFLHSFGYTFFGGLTTLGSFVILIVFLIFRPQGLWGSE